MFDQERWDNETGLLADILWALSRKLNFTFNTIVPADGNWGYRKANETEFNGIVGYLQRYNKSLFEIVFVDSNNFLLYLEKKQIWLLQA